MEEKFRCHPTIIVEKLKGVITFLILITIGNIKEAKEIFFYGEISQTLLIFLGLFALLVFVLIYNILVWSKTYISIEGNTIVVQKNTIHSKVNTYGIKNIANINLEQNIFEMVFGTYRIKIDTDSLSTADKTDIEIVLSKEKAYEFKNTILSLMQNEKRISDESSQQSNLHEEENIDYDIVYSTNEVLKHCFFNLSIGKILLSLGALAFTIYVSMKVDGVEGLIATFILIVTSCFSVLKLFIGDLFKYYKFSIKRCEDELYVSYGMLKKRKYTIPINRINAININQPLISRIFNRYTVDIVTIGVGDDESEGSQILLSSTQEDFLRNMKILLPEIEFNKDTNLIKQPRKCIIISIVEKVIRLAIAGLILYCTSVIVNEISKILLIVWFGLFLMLILMTYMSYITIGCYVGENNIITSHGVFAKRISIIKYEKVQYLNIKENPISTKLDLCKGELHILGGVGNDLKFIGYYDLNLFEKIKENII